MITVYVAKVGTIGSMYDWFVDEDGLISKDFETYEAAEVFAKTMADYGFDVLITTLMVNSDD